MSSYEMLSDQDKAVVEGMLAGAREAQCAMTNPAHQVILRAGFILAREIMARLVKREGQPGLATALRHEWLPAFGDDPGSPRKLHFSEIVAADDMENGPWTPRDPGAAAEGAVYAYQTMLAFGLEVPPDATGTP